MDQAGSRAVFGDFEARQLKSHLMLNYDPGLRPVTDVTHQTTVEVGIDFRQVIEIDEKNQIMTSVVWLRQYWYDEALVWNSTDFWDISYVNIPSNEVWLPDTVLYNSVGNDHNQLMTNVVINSAGYVTWMAPRVFRSSCNIDIYYFPFDDQKCLLEFGSWTYGGYDVNTTTESVPPSLTYFVHNDEWELLAIGDKHEDIFYVCCPEPYPLVTFTIYIRRRSMYYLIFLVSPCLLFSIMTILGFYLPPEAGERVGLGITVLLAFTVFLLMVSELMPPTSSAVPLIVCYYGVTIMLVMFATFMTILILNLHHTDPSCRPLPPWVRRAFLHGLGRVFCTGPHQAKAPPGVDVSLSNCTELEFLCEEYENEIRVTDNGKNKNVEDAHAPDKRYVALLRALRMLMRELHLHVIKCQQMSAANESRDNDWKRVARVLDKLCVALFTFTTVVTAVAVLLKVPHINL
ncbi:neuronal acetylcholine receptor subunit alpha-10-like [Branchiostoma floridae x Branchiostoma belcheri]